MNNHDNDVTQAEQSSIGVQAVITKKFSFNSLPVDRAVQNLYVSTAKQSGTVTTRTIYVTQRIVDVTYLSRFTVTNESATAIYQERMELPGFGHGETLDYLGDDYFLIGCKVETDNPPSERWSLQIGILKYAAGTSPAYTSLRRFTYMNYANKTATSMGTTIRVAAATLPLPKYTYEGTSVYPELEGIVSQDGVFYFMSSAGGTADKQHIYTTAIF